MARRDTGYTRAQLRAAAEPPLYLPGLLLVRGGAALALHVGLAFGWQAGHRAAIARGAIPLLPPQDGATTF